MRRDNGLNKVTAVGAVLVGTFLILGAYGHFEAVWPSITGDDPATDAKALLLPGLILAASGLLGVTLCKALWDGRRQAFDVAIAINALTLVYLVYLLGKGVPDHPIGVFTGVVACNLVLVLAPRLGLVWPARASATDEEGVEP